MHLTCQESLGWVPICHILATFLQFSFSRLVKGWAWRQRRRGRRQRRSFAARREAGCSTQELNCDFLFVIVKFSHCDDQGHKSLLSREENLNSRVELLSCFDKMWLWTWFPVIFFQGENRSWNWIAIWLESTLYEALVSFAKQVTIEVSLVSSI